MSPGKIADFGTGGRENFLSKLPYSPTFLG